MELSVTGFKLWHENQERYRLSYMKGIEPAKMGDALGRGSAFHKWEEARYKGMNLLDVREDLLRKGATDEQIERGFVLAEFAWNERNANHFYDQFEKIGCEVEFNIKVGKHRMIGVIDEVLRNKSDNTLRVGEFKTGSERTKLAELQEEWTVDPQADTELIGLHALYPLDLSLTGNSVHVTTVIEKLPPDMWEFIIDRSDEQLKNMLRSWEITCEQIELTIKKFGIEKPWPHYVPTKWSTWLAGRCKKGTCDYSSVCGQVFESMPEGFKERERHVIPPSEGEEEHDEYAFEYTKLSVLEQEILKNDPAFKATYGVKK